MPEPFVYSRDDVLDMLDRLLASQGSTWWGEFFADRAKPCPFFVDWPDENLAQWFGDGTLVPGRVLELGCGHGRNALWLAGQGCHVDAVDFSAQAIDWASERARSAAATVHFQRCSIFDATFAAASYDLVYDAGCFHHLAPHRRLDCVRLVSRALRPGGSYGLVADPTVTISETWAGVPTSSAVPRPASTSSALSSGWPTTTPHTGTACGAPDRVVVHSL